MIAKPNVLARKAHLRIGKSHRFRDSESRFRHQAGFGLLGWLLMIQAWTCWESQPVTLIARPRAFTNLFAASHNSAWSWAVCPWQALPEKSGVARVEAAMAVGCSVWGWMGWRGGRFRGKDQCGVARGAASSPGLIVTGPGRLPGGWRDRK